MTNIIRECRILIAVILATCFFPILGRSQGKIDGLFYADYYYVFRQHRESIRDQHGFWIRRLYFTYSNDITEKIKMRFRLEMASPGDFISADKLVPNVKDIYLSYAIGNNTLMFGIIPDPIWDNLEDFWGYRPVEKTPLDLYNWGSSRDFGISLKGDLNSKKTVSYWIMYGNGASTKGETDKGKKGYGLLRFKPVKGLLVDIYGDYEHQKDNKIYSVYQGYAGYENSWGKICVQYARRLFRQNNVKNHWTLFSTFIVMKIAKAVNMTVRYDKMLDLIPGGEQIPYIPFSNLAPSNFLLGAISWEVVKNVSFIPNIKYVFYDTPSSGEKPSKDIYLNLTVFFKY